MFLNSFSLDSDVDNIRVCNQVQKLYLWISNKSVLKLSNAKQYNVFPGLANAASNNASLDITAIALLGFCSSQIDILCERLRKFEFSEIENENFEYLRICARHHNKIIKYVFRV